MKYLLRINSFFIIISLFIFSCEKTEPEKQISAPEKSYCDSIEALGIYNDYVYPIVPGSNEWDNFNDEQKHRVLLIPENTLLQMCTHSLIKTCINYPLLEQITTYEYFDQWWENINTTFNGISNLSGRDNSAQKMLKLYLEFNEYPFLNPDSSSSEKMEISTRLTFIEFFLAHENIVSAFTNEELILLGNRAKQIWDIKNENLTQPNHISPTYSCYLLGRIMYYNNYGSFIIKCNANKDLDDFVKIGSYSDYYSNAFPVIIESYESFKNYLNN